MMKQWRLILSFLIILISIGLISGTLQITTVYPDAEYSSETLTPQTARDGVLYDTYMPNTGTLLTTPWITKQALLDFLEKAQYSIDMWYYQITDPEVIQLLKNKATLWVQVRIMLENKTFGDKSKDFQTFVEKTASSTIELRTDEHLWTNFIHAKTILIDNKQYSISTANATYSSFFLNRDYRFFWSDPLIASALHQLFETDRSWKPLKDQPPPSLRVCPINCKPALLHFLSGTTESIMIQAQYLEDPTIISMLIDLHTRGKDIDIMVGKYQDRSLLEWVPFTIHILEEPTLHAKNIVRDGSHLYVWSMNLSTNALEQNREIGIVTTDKKAIERFQTQFAEDMLTARPLSWNP